MQTNERPNAGPEADYASVSRNDRWSETWTEEQEMYDVGEFSDAFAAVFGSDYVLADGGEELEREFGPLLSGGSETPYEEDEKEIMTDGGSPQMYGASVESTTSFFKEMKENGREVYKWEPDFDKALDAAENAVGYVFGSKTVIADGGDSMSDLEEDDSEVMTHLYGEKAGNPANTGTELEEDSYSKEVLSDPTLDAAIKRVRTDEKGLGRREK